MGSDKDSSNKTRTLSELPCIRGLPSFGGPEAASLVRPWGRIKKLVVRVVSGLRFCVLLRSDDSETGHPFYVE